MTTMTLKSLVQKMDSNTRQALEQAVGLCCQHTHHSVELEHLLRALLDTQDAQLTAVLRHFGLDGNRLGDELAGAMAEFRTGSGATPSLSPRLVDLLRQCWLDTSIEFGESAISAGPLVYSLLNDPAMAALATRYARSLEAIDPQQLLHDWPELRGQDAPATPAGGQPRRERNLDQFTVDLTAQARDGKLDPVLGREAEIRQMIDILSRRRQNNPILTGEAGVGKTAVVEGLARQIAAGEVPEGLRQARLLVLDLALLQAGAGVKGEFENRLKGVIDEVKGATVPVILFIDEAHNMVGAGGQAGQNDAANLLKPALARGELRTIAATTWAEYKKFFEKDAALSRRFQVVKVEEPDDEMAVRILRGLVPTLEAHHQTRVTDAAVRASVSLTRRYLPGRQLPDKAVALLDTACARVAMSQAGVPTELEEARARRRAIDAEIDQLVREMRGGVEHQPRMDALEAERLELGDEIARLEAAWRDEQGLVKEAITLDQRLDESPEEASQQALSQLRNRLATRERPLLHWQVDESLVAEVLADWTGIPLGRLQADQISAVLDLGDRLRERVKGQDHALDIIARSMRVARANLADENKPLGVFLLAGPSGVGKTETALALAEQFYGSEASMTVINMSEFKEEHKLSQLVGSPPGYVGYGEGGILTEAVRRRPYSVILLDEMEKAHPGVQELFYQVFDKGRLRDGEGQDVDFRNTVILMTSNAGAELIADLYADEATAPEPEALKDAIWEPLQQVFKPAFLGRCTLLPYRPLDKTQLEAIARLQLARISDRLQRQHDARFIYDDAVVNALVERCTQASSGARNIQQVLQQQVLPLMSETILQQLAEEQPVGQITLEEQAGEFSVSL